MAKTATNSPTSDNVSKRQALEILRAQLELERSSHIGHWKDLANNILPRRPRFVLSDTNRGERRNLAIVDTTATLACRTLKSGMMGGVTSPARPWFKLTTPDPDIAELPHVKDWLTKVEDNMSGVFLRSNLYQCLPNVYGDLGTFANAAMMVEEDFGNVVRFYVFPIGSYMMSVDEKGRVNVFLRDFRMTVRQLVNKFGKSGSGGIDWTNISDYVRNAWYENRREQWIDVCHVILPNDEYDENSPSAKHKKFSSCYYERGGSGGTTQGQIITSTASTGDGKILRESGYDYFPVMCPRWEVTGEDAYGTDCPGMTALGDIKQLYTMIKRRAQAAEKKINPALKGPSALLSRKVSLLPGDFTADDAREGQQGLRPVHEVAMDLAEFTNLIAEIRHNIQRAFFEDLFLLASNDERSNVTAMEIGVRKEEKLLMLGSVLEQLNQDLLDPLIDNTFEIMLRQSRDANGQFFEHGLIPPPPPEVQGMKLKVEYVSIMAAAQKALALTSIERFSSFIREYASVDPGILMKVNRDKMAEQYADGAGLSTHIIHTDEEVQAMQQQQAQAAAAQQKMAAMQQGADAAQKLGSTDMTQDSALTRLVDSANAGALAPGAGQ